METIVEENCFSIVDVKKTLFQDLPAGEYVVCEFLRNDGKYEQEYFVKAIFVETNNIYVFTCSRGLASFLLGEEETVSKKIKIDTFINSEGKEIKYFKNETTFDKIASLSPAWYTVDYIEIKGQYKTFLLHLGSLGKFWASPHMNNYLQNNFPTKFPVEMFFMDANTFAFQK